MHLNLNWILVLPIRQQMGYLSTQLWVWSRWQYNQWLFHLVFVCFIKRTSWESKGWAVRLIEIYSHQYVAAAWMKYAGPGFFFLCGKLAYLNRGVLWKCTRIALLFTDGTRSCFKSKLTRWCYSDLLWSSDEWLRGNFVEHFSPAPGFRNSQELKVWALKCIVAYNSSWFILHTKGSRS